MPKNSEIGDFLGFQHPFCRKTPKKKWKVDPLLPKKHRKNLHNAEKNLSLARYCVLRGKKEKLFGSISQANKYNLKFCRTFGRTKSVTSDVSKNTDEKP